MEDIAEKAGVSKASFYTYFKDKADLVDALLEPVAGRLLAAFGRCEEALRAAEDHGSLVAAYAELAAECGAALPVAGAPLGARALLGDAPRRHPDAFYPGP